SPVVSHARLGSAVALLVLLAGTARAGRVARSAGVLRLVALGVLLHTAALAGTGVLQLRGLLRPAQPGHHDLRFLLLPVGLGLLGLLLLGLGGLSGRRGLRGGGVLGPALLRLLGVGGDHGDRGGG